MSKNHSTTGSHPVSRRNSFCIDPSEISDSNFDISFGDLMPRINFNETPSGTVNNMNEFPRLPNAGIFNNRKSVAESDNTTAIGKSNMATFQKP